MVKQRLFTLAIWIVVSVISFFAMDKDGAPDWAKELELLVALGVFFILLDTLLDTFYSLIDEL